MSSNSTHNHRGHEIKMLVLDSLEGWAWVYAIDGGPSRGRSEKVKTREDARARGLAQACAEIDRGELAQSSPP
jgi:hypothetical protein